MVDRSKRRSRRAKVVRVAVFTVVGLLVPAAGAAGYAYWKFNDNVKSVDIDGQLGTSRPPAASDGSFNVLVLGSDSRAGANGALVAGGVDSGRSDTAMVIHVNQSHTQAQVVSIPRDTLVARPECAGPKGRTIAAAQSAMFNSAFAVGGAACAVKTAEQLTGLRMDHYIQLDFVGFAAVIDAIGGVDITTTVDINDNHSDLRLPAGSHHLNGTQALAFVRTRYGVGDGGDLGRIELEKEMVKSMLHQIDSVGALSNPARLWSLGDKLTQSLTTDTQLASVSSLVDLASELKSIGPDKVAMVTVPAAPAPGNSNRLVEKQPAADQLWAALRADQLVPEAIVSSQPANPANSTPSPSAGSGQ